jgi:hypothetical protein
LSQAGALKPINVVCPRFTIYVHDDRALVGI